MSSFCLTISFGRIDKKVSHRAGIGQLVVMDSSAELID
jgi:hypothetical protein